MNSFYTGVSFDVSRTFTKSYSTSFSMAVNLLSRDDRNAIRGIYGFVRIADEIVDNFSHIDQKKYLNELELQLNLALKDGLSTNPLIHSFVIAVKRYHIPEEYITAFLKSMRMDLIKSDYKSDIETRNYIYGSAEVIGLMCLKVFLKNDHARFDSLNESARMLGSAFQKVNFLRDLGEDLNKLNRSYFPDVNLKLFDEKKKDTIIQQIENEFIIAKRGIHNLPGKSRLAVFLAFTYYKHLLKRLKKTPADKMIISRVRVPNITKLYLCLRSVIAFRLGLV